MRIRLNEKGIPSPKGKRGDLYLDVRVIPPPAPNDEERAILEQFAKARAKIHDRRWSRQKWRKKRMLSKTSNS